MTDKKYNLNPQTLAIHGGVLRSEHGETSEAIYLSSGFSYATAESAQARFDETEPGYVYSRFDNPTVNMFETRTALLEGAEAAKATASGMAAVFAALMSNLKQGDHVIAAKTMFFSCRHIIETVLPQYGIDTTLVDATDIDNWRQAIQNNSKIFFIETPANPNGALTDIRAVADLAHNCGAKLIVDNAMASPIAQLPLLNGADIVIYSATKHIDGQGRCIGGVVLGKEDYIKTTLFDFHKHSGSSLSPFNAWVLLKGLETLAIRVEQQSKNALAIASWLEGNDKIEKVCYPGLPSHPQYELAKSQMILPGTMISFYVKPNKKASFEFMNALKLALISNNLGDTKTLITHPATTTHKNLAAAGKIEAGITENLLRLSVGLEYFEDIISDFEQSIERISV